MHNPDELPGPLKETVTAEIAPGHGDDNRLAPSRLDVAGLWQEPKRLPIGIAKANHRTEGRIICILDPSDPQVCGDIHPDIMPQSATLPLFASSGSLSTDLVALPARG